MYPVLSRMAMDIISVQASSVASESTFLTSGRVLSIRRTRLTPASLEMCMCLKDHLDAKERKQDKSPLEIPLDFEEDVLDDEVQRNEAIPLSDEEIALDDSSEGTLSPGGPRMQMRMWVRMWMGVGKGKGILNVKMNPLSYTKTSDVTVLYNLFTYYWLLTDINGRRKVAAKCPKQPLNLLEVAGISKGNLGDVDLGWSNKAGTKADCSHDDLLCDMRENEVELLQRCRRDKKIFLNCLMSGTLIKKVVIPHGSVSLDDVDVDQVSVDFVLNYVKKKDCN
ncbi:zinc finger BED domain-containing protein RICESLEEPER 2 [Tanacetum coccineum]